jgi:alpha-L-arabinofuranosidase
MKIKKEVLIAFLLILSVNNTCIKKEESITIEVFPGIILNDVSHHPIGINVNYLMDDDKYLQPAIRTADALKAMGVRYLRYPGGNKSDLYLFSSPPYEKAEPRLARTGKGAVGYSRVIKDDREFRFDVLDFDEFIEMCREINAEPIIVVAADEYLRDFPPGTTVTGRDGLITNAVEWVRYANVKKNYGVRYWMIGNECWHNNNENSTAEIYARDVVDFSRAMKEVDPSIYIIPNGNSVEFCETVLTIAGDHIDHFTISNYPIFNYRAGYATYRDTLQDIMAPVKRALTAMKNTGMPEDMKLIVSEYGPFDWGYLWPMTNDMGHNLFNFEMTGEQLQTPEIDFSIYWNTRWIENDTIENSVYDALDMHGNFNAIGYGLMIWGNYLGDKMVKTTGTVHIRSFASYSPLDGYMYVYLLNKAEKTIPVNLSIHDFKVEAIEMFSRLGSTGPDDVDPVWEENIPITNRDLKRLELPGVSVSVLKLKLI